MIISRSIFDYFLLSEQVCSSKRNLFFFAPDCFLDGEFFWIFEEIWEYFCEILLLPVRVIVHEFLEFIIVLLQLLLEESMIKRMKIFPDLSIYYYFWLFLFHCREFLVAFVEEPLRICCRARRNLRLDHNLIHIGGEQLHFFFFLKVKIFFLEAKYIFFWQKNIKKNVFFIIIFSLKIIKGRRINERKNN